MISESSEFTLPGLHCSLSFVFSGLFLWILGFKIHSMKSHLLLSLVFLLFLWFKECPYSSDFCLTMFVNFIYKIETVLLQGKLIIRLAFFFGPSHPLNTKISSTYCFTTRFPASRADWKEQKLAKDSLKTKFSSLQQLLAFLFPFETKYSLYQWEYF